MRLYLSSYRFGEIARLVELAGEGVRTAVVSNALDFIPEDRREAFRRNVHDPVAELEEVGMPAFDIDLRRYFGASARLEADLEGVGLVFATGGNAFLLRRAMRQSGLDDILGRRLAADSIVYGGWSAGACVAGASLRGLHLMDDPAEVAAGYDPAPIHEGLGLVDFVIVPHFGSDHPEAEAATIAADWLAREGVPYKTLRDGEVLVGSSGDLSLVR